MTFTRTCAYDSPMTPMTIDRAKAEALLRAALEPEPLTTNELLVQMQMEWLDAGYSPEEIAVATAAAVDALGVEHDCYAQAEPVGEGWRCAVCARPLD